MTFCLNFLKYRRQEKQQEINQTPQTLNTGRVFGCDLQKHLAAAGGQRLIPAIVEWCASYIEHHIIAQQKAKAPGENSARNIYRVPGSKSDIDSLKAWFETATGEPDLATLTPNSPGSRVNAVASLLKHYFAQLPQPLVPSQLHPQLIELSKVQVSYQTVEQTLRHNLQQHSYATLFYLIKHLKWISEQPNAMSVEALGTVWAPNIFQSQTPLDVVQHIRAMEMLIRAAPPPAIVINVPVVEPEGEEMEEETPNPRRSVTIDAKEMKERRRRKVAEQEVPEMAMWRKSLRLPSSPMNLRLIVEPPIVAKAIVTSSTAASVRHSALYQQPSGSNYYAPVTTVRSAQNHNNSLKPKSAVVVNSGANMNCHPSLTAMASTSSKVYYCTKTTPSSSVMPATRPTRYLRVVIR